MGRSKAWLPFGNESLLQRIVRVAAQAASPIVLATRQGMELPPLSFEFEAVCDYPGVAGPLAGIAAGMIALRGKSDAVLVVACDHPFVSAAVFHRMIELLGDHSAVVPELAGRLVPTLAVYRMSTLKILEDLLSNGELRAQEFALRCHPLRIGAADLANLDPDLRSFSNVNNPAEYEAALDSTENSSSKG
jgi:molybdopterin-guanine dinucleotide biosynthesis protein A